jgi:hypothetical protein
MLPSTQTHISVGRPVLYRKCTSSNTRLKVMVGDIFSQFCCRLKTVRKVTAFYYDIKGNGNLNGFHTKIMQAFFVSVS